MRMIRGNVERIANEQGQIAKLKAEGFKEIHCAQGRKEAIPAGEAEIAAGEVKAPEKISTADLRKLAKEKGIEGYSSLSKDELLAVLKDVV